MREEMHWVIHRTQRKDILKMLKRTYLWIRSTTSLDHNKMHRLNLLTLFDLQRTKTLLMKMNKDMHLSRRVVNLIHRKQILGLITRLNLNLRLRNLMLKPISTSLRRKTAPITVAYSIQHTEDDVAIENRTRGAFIARRTQPIKKGSRELRVIPPEWRDNFAQSDFDEWKKWLSYDAVERPRPEELDGLEKNDVLTSRMIRTDKNEATRG